MAETPSNPSGNSPRVNGFDGVELPSAAQPNAARIYDYLLGGKDFLSVDQKAAAELQKVFPHAEITARENRRFMARAVGFLARRGVTQFLDVGTGIPTSTPDLSNLHEVVQGIQPRARVVYVDNDPVVMAHARALLTGTGQGSVGYVRADLRKPQRILDSAPVRALDQTRPVALSLIAILHFLRDDVRPHDAVATLIDALPAGSYLIVSHVTNDLVSEAGPVSMEAAADLYRNHGIQAQARDAEEIRGFFDGLEFIDPPGLVPVHRWPADGILSRQVTDAEVSCYGAVALKRNRTRTGGRG
ncbi:SAM-dependent methyltransferase [Streptomyces phytophilus]|uniref:SAM-dependent methyltransferase n=1 Tax=Streptomyces phytophilus TaxID=722715 RepID=UPI0015EFE207|nr:SAM-dependent methyltransferase [Streptomyces phytophilus]